MSATATCVASAAVVSKAPSAVATKPKSKSKRSNASAKALPPPVVIELEDESDEEAAEKMEVVGMEMEAREKNRGGSGGSSGSVFPVESDAEASAVVSSAVVEKKPMEGAEEKDEDRLFDVAKDAYVEEPWILLGSYFRNQHQDRLVRHQLESFNYFSECQIVKTINMFNPVTIHSKNDYVAAARKHRVEVNVTFENFRLHCPQIYENNGAIKRMFPHEARMRNFTYASEMTVDVHVQCTARSGEGLESVRTFNKVLPNIYIGKLPVMVRSNICVLKQYKHLSPAQLSECQFDTGGYFIINGSEKVVLGQERAAENRVYLYNISKNNTKYSWMAEIKSVPDFKCISPKQINMYISSKNAGFGNAICIQIPRVKQPIALFVVFRALGVLSDRDICECILLDLGGGERTDKMLENLQASVMEGAKFMTQMDAIRHIMTYANFTPDQDMDREMGAAKKWQFTLEILQTDLFPHCHTVKQKIYFLGYMARQLMQAHFEWIPASDRDSNLNKRVDLTGVSLNNLFRNYFNKLVKDMDKKTVREIDTGSWRSTEDFENIINHTNIYKLIKVSTIENGFKRALSTGDFGIKHSNSNKVGVAQVLNRLNHIAPLSHLRRISTPQDKSGKLIPPRKLHATSWGYTCPAETPEGASVGVVKNLSYMAHVTIPSENSALHDVILPFIDPLDAAGEQVRVAAACAGATEAWLADRAATAAAIAAAHAAAAAEGKEGEEEEEEEEEQGEKEKDESGSSVGGCGGAAGSNSNNNNTCQWQLQSSQWAGRVKVFVNGAWVGVARDPLQLYAALKDMKVNGVINVYASVVFDRAALEIRICNDAGRLTRPLLRTRDDGKSLYLTHGVLRRLAAGELTWDQLLTNASIPDAVIEYVDAEEQAYCKIASAPRDLAAQPLERFTHCEIHLHTLFGVVASCIPYPDHNQSPRNTYQCAQAKQAMGIYATNYAQRFDKTAYVMVYPMRPLIDTRIMNLLGLDRNPAGCTITVAIMTHTGYNQEDSLLINKGSVDRGLLNITLYHTEKDEDKQKINCDEEIRCKPDATKTKGMKFANYSKVNARGIVPENTRIENRDVIIAKVLPIKENKNDYTKPIKFEDQSRIYKTTDETYLDRNYMDKNGDGYNFAKVRLRALRRPEIGDKFSSRHGQKGTVGNVVPEEDMPFTRNGDRPDIIINPHAIPSRMTIGQLKETLLGKVLIELGLFGDGTSFGDLSVQSISERLLELGMEAHGDELMYNGLTGEMIECSVFMGPVFYQRLKHMVADKQHSRAIGPMVNLTRQPAEGRSRDGGLRFGEMERDCMLSHGALRFTRGRMYDESDKYAVNVCNQCGLIAAYNDKAHVHLCRVCENRTDFSYVEIPYACKLLFQELTAMSVVPRIVTEQVLRQQQQQRSRPEQHPMVTA